jgi:hypothetical protein
VCKIRVKRKKLKVKRSKIVPSLPDGSQVLRIKYKDKKIKITHPVTPSPVERAGER